MNNKNLTVLIVLPLALLLLTGCLAQNNEATAPSISKPEQAAEEKQESANQNTSSEEKPVLAKSIQLSEVAAHSTRDDCWLAINDKVYDITEFIAKGQHKPIITEGCGKDATALFTARPGSGENHPENAYAMLDGYYIGELKQ